LGPTHHDCSGSVCQAGVRCGARRRRCLLKGCRRMFFPLHPLCRYCSEACCLAARIWSRRRAGAQYRKTEGGREKRRKQSRRYRERLRQRSMVCQREPESPEPRPPGTPLVLASQMKWAPSASVKASQPAVFQLSATPHHLTPPAPTAPTPTAPTPTAPAPTVPTPTVPAPTVPTPTVPAPTPAEFRPPELPPSERILLEWTSPQASCGSCEGHHPPGAEKNFFCQRPGCYESFVVSPRSPTQKFCSPLCRQALRSVERREAFWCKRLRELGGTGPPGRIACASRAGCGGKS
jgi:hypothetical protein